MKRFTLILAVLVLAASLVFTACGKKDEGATEPSQNTQDNGGAALTAAEIWNKVNEISGFGEMTAVPKADYSDLYGIDAALIEDSVWYMSSNPSMNADETAIVKAKNAADAESIAEVFRARIARQKDVALAYSPAEATKLNNAEVVVSGSWVFYCVGENGEAMTDLIGSLIK